jgi:hypothetical protein
MVHRSSRAATRAIAILGATLILISTSIGVGHFHEGAVSRNGVATAQLSADAGLCPVCQLALHSPGSIAQATTVARGPAVAEAIFVAAPIPSEQPVLSSARVRAPPVSL